MADEAHIETALIPTDNSSLRKILEISGPVDFLFIGTGTRPYQQELMEYISQRGVELGTVVEVTSNLYSSGGEGELAPGLYGIDDVISASTHRFTAIPDPDRALIMVSNAIQYGRQFREICEVLERYMGRNMSYGSTPPTFAFFKKLYHEDGWVRARNVFTSVGRELGFNYLPIEVAPYIM